MEIIGSSVFLSVFMGMVFFLIPHILVWRVNPANTPRIKLLGLLAVVGVALSVGIDLVFVGINPTELTAVLWIDLFVVTAYFFFYCGIVRSVSVTLLARLLQVSGEPIDFESLVREYASSSCFEDRIKLMEKSGFVRYSDGIVHLTPRGSALARWTKKMSRMIGDGLKG